MGLFKGYLFDCTYSFLKLFLFAFISLFFASCDKDDDSVEEVKSVVFRFDHVFADRDFLLDSIYSIPSEYEVSIEKFKYYLSNFKIGFNGGKEFLIPESYYLVKLQRGSSMYEVRVDSIPDKEIKRLTFSIGVDEEKNHTIDHSGDLDPVNDMVWTWNTGYKFLLMEGRLFLDGVEKALVYHIGEDKNFKTLSFDILEQNSDNSDFDVIEFEVDLNKIFDGKHVLDLGNNSSVISGDEAGKISENYKDMFSVNHLDTMR